jgi:hypothetical protein
MYLEKIHRSRTAGVKYGPNEGLLSPIAKISTVKSAKLLSQQQGRVAFSLTQPNFYKIGKQNDPSSFYFYFFNN